VFIEIFFDVFDYVVGGGMWCDGGCFDFFTHDD